MIAGALLGKNVRPQMLNILATVAKQKRIRISERAHAGLAKGASRGVLAGPRLVVSHEKILTLDQEGCTVREIGDQMALARLGSSRSEGASPSAWRTHLGLTEF